MLRIAFHAIVIAVSTAFFGVLAIVALILIPNGDPLLWFARPWALAITTACGVRVRAIGPENLRRAAPCVILCNHASNVDILALLLALPGQYRVLAKRELFWIPVFGWAIWLAGFIPVDRGRRERALLSIERAAEKVRRGRSVLIFGEGTRSDDGTLQPLKKGGFHLALRSGAPIVPVSIRGSHAVLPKGALRIRPGRIDVVVGDPIATRGRSADDLEELVAEVRAALAAGLERLET
ncbi:MAG: 1-acyl-sn-glycerol-3-phosphate acyltransferase [Acidobacteria bacterium]|nr:1-acyl-sn-glycerol-3-phosphate acyltransferase [Acidobacteriota bacterium]